MPKTWLVFAVGWIAICGIPPFSGFFSKDEILWQAFSSPRGSPVLWGMGALTAFLYTGRSAAEAEPTPGKPAPHENTAKPATVPNTTFPNMYFPRRHPTKRQSKA